MKKFLVILALLAGASFAATDTTYGQGNNAASGTNSLGFHRWSALDTVGQDTLFGYCNVTSACNTSDFVINRNPLNNNGMLKASAVVQKNPDSIVCLIGLQRKDADTGDVNTGVQFYTAAQWNFYRGSASGATGTNLALTYYRSVGAYVPNTPYRWFYNGATATDTTIFKYADCQPKFNP